MAIVKTATPELRGISFGIADLMVFAAWSEAYGVQMMVRLDHASETEEYEEVLAFHPEPGGPCRWMIWRDEQAVFVQPLLGRTRRFASVTDAIGAFVPGGEPVLTDIAASRWPDRKPR